MNESLSVAEARRLALARSGLLKPEWTGLRPGRGASSRREAAYDAVRRFGYLQLDTVSIAGARSHGIVLHSRIPRLDPEVPERLLRPGEPLFEYWGHEASWIPIELYPAFGFRRREFQKHPWWGDLLGENPRVARSILDRIRAEGPLRSAALEGRVSAGWWNLSIAKKVVSALWSAGTVAVRERVHFQRVYDLTERVIPAKWRKPEPSLEESLKVLLSKALEGHGWATTATLAATFRLRSLRKPIDAALAELSEADSVRRCVVVSSDGRRHAGWVRPEDLELAARLRRLRPRSDEGVLLSPFDPLLWDRSRTRLLFGFEQVLEVFKPAAERTYGYYCLPVLAGETLVARCDLKAEKSRGALRVLSTHCESGASASGRRAARLALERFARSLGLALKR